jgi:hypothetical protein
MTSSLDHASLFLWSFCIRMLTWFSCLTKRVVCVVHQRILQLITLKNKFVTRTSHEASRVFFILVFYNHSEISLWRGQAMKLVVYFPFSCFINCAIVLATHESLSYWRFHEEFRWNLSSISCFSASLVHVPPISSRIIIHPLNEVKAWEGRSNTFVRLSLDSFPKLLKGVCWKVSGAASPIKFVGRFFCWLIVLRTLVTSVRKVSHTILARDIKPIAIS